MVSLPPVSRAAVFGTPQYTQPPPESQRTRGGRTAAAPLIFPGEFAILTGIVHTPMAAQEGTHERVVATNRKARHDYFVLETLEAGLALTGTEVKSVRQARINLTDGFAEIKNGEVWLIGVHISPYQQGSYANVDPRRSRKLLLHRKEIRKLLSRVGEPGVTLVPLRVYFAKNIAKLELAVCRGKRHYDKRQAIAQREAERDMQRIHRR